MGTSGAREERVDRLADVVDVFVAHRMVAGQDEARLHHAVGIGQTVCGRSVRDLREPGLAQDVAAPDHARVDPLALHPLLELAAPYARLAPDLERKEMPCGVELDRGTREN